MARQLLLNLVPDGHGFQTAHPRPRFRPLTEEPPATRADLARRAAEIADLLLDDLDDDPGRHLALIDKVTDLPPQQRAVFARRLSSLAERLDDDEARARLHDALRGKTAHHREYADTAWALADDQLIPLEAAAVALRPRDPVRQAQWLFASDWITLGDQRRRDDFQAYDAELASRRANAVAQVLAAGGLDAVARLAAGTEHSQAVGTALAAAAPAHDAETTAWLAGADNDDGAAKAQAETGYAYIAARLRDGGTALIDDLLALTVDPVAQALILLAGRKPEDAWARLAALPDHVGEQYWKRFSYLGLGSDFPAVLEAAHRLIQAGRYAAAIDMMAIYSDRNDTAEAAEVAATALEGLLAGGTDDPELRRLTSHDFERVFALLGRHRLAIGGQRVLNLEWQLFPALGFEADAPALHAALADQPTFFAELVAYLYKRDDGAPDADGEDAPQEFQQLQEMATRAYDVLRSWRRCPGAGPDNKPDPRALDAWVAQARARLVDDARLGPGDREIGQGLAWAAPNDDGTYPPRTVRNLLETIRSDRLDEGLEIGILNKLGVTSRGVYDGGKQEHALADRYSQAADAAGPWPRTRRLLRRLADSYERDARREDGEAERLRRGLDH